MEHTSTDQFMERLISMTDKAQINWRYIWDDRRNPSSMEDMRDMARPVAYHAEHDELGRLLLSVDDKMMESDSPVLFINGNRIDTSSLNTSLLRDQIVVYLRDLSMGTVDNPLERVNEYYNSLMDAHQEERMAFQYSTDELIHQIREQTALVSQALTLAQSIQGSPAPVSASAKPTFSTEMLKAALAIIEDNTDSTIKVDDDLLESIVEALSLYAND